MTKDYSLFKNGDRCYSMNYNKKHGIPITVILNCTKTNCKKDHTHWCAKCRLHYRLVHECIGIIEMTGARTSCRHKAKHTEFGLYGGVYDLCDKCRLDLPNHIEEHKRDDNGVWRTKTYFECYEKLTPEQRESHRKRQLLD